MARGGRRRGGRALTAVATLLAASVTAAGDSGAGGSDYGQYFAVYAHPDIHRQMLQDRLRTEAYGEALLREPAVVRGKTVLDFGCGTGILSLFAARAGAQRVICVEGSELAAVTERVVERNNFSSIIHVLRTTHDKLKLPSKVDVIISEWMGFLLVMEDMLDDLLQVRDRWLKPGGVLWPRYAQLWLQPYGDAEWWAENVGYWDSRPYGFDLSPMGSYAFKESKEWPWPIRGQWRPAGLTGRPHLACDWDLQSLRMPKSFKLASRFRESVNSTVHGVLIWFDMVFDHPEGNVTLSTHPAQGVQHWGQIFWPLRGAPLEAPGLRLEGTLRMRRRPPAWDFGLSWRAPPLVTQTVQAKAMGLQVEHFTTADDWTTRKGLEAFLAAGEAGQGAGQLGEPPRRKAPSSEL